MGPTWKENEKPKLHDSRTFLFSSLDEELSEHGYKI
jgi:hypothetical protein